MEPLTLPMPTPGHEKKKSGPQKLRSRLSVRARWAKANSLLVLAALLTQIGLAAFPARGATFFIATNGNDSWSGAAPAFVSGTDGPWRTFTHINYGAKPGLHPGDVVYVRGGIYDHTSDSVATSIRLISLYGTPSSPIIISNYPGEWPVIYGSSSNNSTIALTHAAWVQIFGINSSNAYRSPCFQYVTNCEIARCDFGGGGAHIGYLPAFAMYNCSQFNWIHDCVVHDSPTRMRDDSTHNMTFGLFYSSNDFTACNLIESNVCYHAGHEALSSYGPSNVLAFNWVHNEPIHFRQDYMLFCGHRDLELGGSIGNHNVVEHNWFAHAGVVGNAGSHGIEVSDGSFEIIRNNYLVENDYSGFVVYGGKVRGIMSESNYIYNNTIAFNGFAQRYITNYDARTNITSVKDNRNWKNAVVFVHTTNNVFINNIVWGNDSDRIFQMDGAINLARLANNLIGSNPHFRNSTDGGAWTRALPDCSFTEGPAVDAGAFLARITSPSGSGTVLSVDDPHYFFAGLTAAGHVVPGDTIQLQGQTATAAIMTISGKTITVGRPLNWKQGQGVALAFSGAAPDAGAYEFAATSPAMKKEAAVP